MIHLHAARGIAAVFLLWWCGVWLMHLICIYNAKRRLHRRSPIPRDADLPGVSILKPLCGMDNNLPSNLETFFTQDYTEFELLICVADDQDPCVEVARQLMQKYPQVDARLFTNPPRVGLNPKVNNVNPGYEVAKHKLILMSDSGMRMKVDTLRVMVSEMNPEVGIVHQMPYTSDRDSFVSLVEKVFFGTYHARHSMVSDFRETSLSYGMSSLMRKEHLDSIGGFKAFSDSVVEDYCCGKSFQKSGWKIRVSSEPAWQNPDTPGCKVFVDRLDRWQKIYMSTSRLNVLLIPLTHCVPVGVVASWSLSVLFGCDVLFVLLSHAAVWFVSDLALISIIEKNGLPFSVFVFAFVWALREAAAVFFYFRALVDQRLKWKSRTIYLKSGGQIAREYSQEK